MNRAAIVWTKQSRFLWTARRGRYPAGTIEQGRRFTFTGTDGCSTRHRTFAEAQGAAEID